MVVCTSTAKKMIWWLLTTPWWLATFHYLPVVTSYLCLVLVQDISCHDHDLLISEMVTLWVLDQLNITLVRVYLYILCCVYLHGICQAYYSLDLDCWRGSQKLCHSHRGAATLTVIPAPQTGWTVFSPLCYCCSSSCGECPPCTCRRCFSCIRHSCYVWQTWACVWGWRLCLCFFGLLYIPGCPKQRCVCVFYVFFFLGGGGVCGGWGDWKHPICLSSSPAVCVRGPYQHSVLWTTGTVATTLTVLVQGG